VRERRATAPARKEITVEIGKPERFVTVEPLTDPVPREQPAEPPEKEEPRERPTVPEKVPAR
jgi:hypothetical protein